MHITSLAAMSPFTDTPALWCGQRADHRRLMRLPRRTCCAAAVAAMTTTVHAACDSCVVAAFRLRTLLEDYGEKLERRRAELAEQASLEEQLIAVNAQELELEAELEGVLNALDTPRSVLTPAQASGVEALLARLEVTRGRQQRYGWGQSSDANDLPYYGAWNIVFATEQASFGTQRDSLILKSARNGSTARVLAASLPSACTRIHRTLPPACW